MARSAGESWSRPVEALVSGRRRELDRRLRVAFLAGAEEHSRATLGRGLTEDELRRVIGRFPGGRSAP